jgi:AhpD family alkylhydroperoxidase
MAKVDSLCEAGHLAKTARFAEWTPAALKGFQALQQGAFAPGRLSVKEKELVAFGCSHVLRCPYCIDYHHGLATRAGATREELAEAVWVAIAVAAHGVLAHASVTMRCLDGAEPEYYGTAWREALARFRPLVPAANAGFDALDHAAFAPGALSPELKLLVAVGCAHNEKCPLSIDSYVNAALAAGIEKPAIAEAAWVAIEMAAGACLGHSGLAAALME